MPRGFSKSYREASVALTVSAVTGLLAGLVLGYMSGTLKMLPGLMVLIPPAIAMRGNIFGALGSRLGTAMHIGVYSTEWDRRGSLAQNVYASIVLTVVGSVALGYVAALFSEALGYDSIGLGGFVLISIVGGVLSGAVLLVATIGLAELGFRRGWDIDNTMAPLVTAIGDFLTLPAIYVAALIYLGTPPGLVNLSLILLTVVAAVSLEAAHRSSMVSMRRIVIQSAPPLILAAGVNVLSGLVLESQLDVLVAMPALLVLIPPFLEEAGALGGVLSSRLSSRIHTGLLSDSLNPFRARGEFLMVLILALYVFPLVGVLSHVFAAATGLASPGPVRMAAISTSAGLLTGVVVFITAFSVSVVSFKRGFDPDNFAIPLVTSATDVVGVLLLLGAIAAVT